MADDYGVQYTIKVALETVGREFTIAGLVEAGYTEKEAEGMVARAEAGMPDEPCIHPGIFAFNDDPTQHCSVCGRDVPIAEL